MELFTVSSLTSEIKKNLESKFNLIAVKGEISNFKAQSSGHLYFTLKDKDSQISCALFRLNVAKLQKLPKDGDLVICIGEISVFAPRGNYQLIVRDLRFEGLGDLLLKFQEQKAKLSALGWFDSAHKKKLSPFPKTIGVVTSPTGAVIQDILQVLARRHKGFHLILNPVQVQGEGSAAQIAKAINDFNRYQLADVLIVGRGGGSLEDLWAFNEEIVAKAIFDSSIPIISAVGHETDFSIADFVADVRAPTPSAAAEMVACDKNLEIQKLISYKKRLSSYVTANIRDKKGRLEEMKKRFVSGDTLLKEPYLRLDQAEERLKNLMAFYLKEKKNTCQHLLRRLHDLSPGVQLAQKKALLGPIADRLTMTLKQQITIKKERLQNLSAHLFSIDPKNLLKNGYAIVFHQKSASVILSAKEVQNQEPLTIMLHDGKILAEVREITHG